MNLNIINIGEKELCSAMRSLVNKENINCNTDEATSSQNSNCNTDEATTSQNSNCKADDVASSLEVPSNHEIVPDNEHEANAGTATTDNLMKIKIVPDNEREANAGTAATNNLVKINERLENIASEITSNKEIIVRLDDDLRDQASNIGENSENIEKLEKRMTEIQSGSNVSNLNSEIRLIKAEYETRAMDMKSYLDMIVDRINDIENSANDKFSNKLDNVEVSLNENITTLRTYIDDLVMGIRTFLNKLEKELDRSSDQNENIENIIGGLSSDIILNSDEINNLRKVVQSYKDENSGLSERINNLVAANINRNLTPRHE